MSYHIYSFEKLEVYQLARKYKIDIKLTSRLFPKEERFELISQMETQYLRLKPPSFLKLLEFSRG